jgi:hypothetical protein
MSTIDDRPSTIVHEPWSKVGGPLSHTLVSIHFADFQQSAMIDGPWSMVTTAWLYSIGRISNPRRWSMVYGPWSTVDCRWSMVGN